MKNDKRKAWEFNGCKVVPESGESRYFGHPDFTPNCRLPLYYSNWWRINFPNGTYCLSATRNTVMDYVDSPTARAQGGLA